MIERRVHAMLPIFRLDEQDRVIFYTPGHVTVTTRERADEFAPELAAPLESQARLALAAWRAAAERPFEPECLTLYLSNRCNLGCAYCYAAPPDADSARLRLRMLPASDLEDRFPLLSVDAAAAAAQLVARNCQRKGLPLTLVLHGGGEPTLHWELLEHVDARVRHVATEHGVGYWSYIATHGVLPEERVRTLARRFNLIGLSCDGPPDIQNASRPTAGGAPTAAIVERTADILAAEGAAYTVRATIRPSVVHRQRDILTYACDRLGARVVRFEPAYDARRTSGPHFAPDEADLFVEHFLDACELARQRGCDLQVSGARPDEIHGPYCNPLRDVLQLTPDGRATACFLCTGSADAHESLMQLGSFDRATGAFRLDGERAASLRRLAARVPARCEHCVNVLHCARDCPDVCVLTANAADEWHGGFRCGVQKRLGLHWIRTAARKM